MSPAFSNLQRGFTLAEMMTVTAIFIIMTGVVLGNLPEFRDRASLELVAQEVALVIRQAQAYGSNTRATLFDDATTFPSYGIYFNLVSGESPVFPSENAFRLFADADESGHYSDAESDTCGTTDAECREVYNLTGGLRIKTLAVCPSVDVCNPINSASPLNVVFTRPNPEAVFLDGDGDNLCAGAGCVYAKITLESIKNNQMREVCIWNTGHIYTKSICP